MKTSFVFVFVQVVSSELASLGQSHNSLQATAAGLRQDLGNAQNLVSSSTHVLAPSEACSMWIAAAPCWLRRPCCVHLVSLLLLVMPAGARA